MSGDAPSEPKGGGDERNGGCDDTRMAVEPRPFLDRGDDATASSLALLVSAAAADRERSSAATTAASTASGLPRCNIGASFSNSATGTSANNNSNSNNGGISENAASGGPSGGGLNVRQRPAEELMDLIQKAATGPGSKRFQQADGKSTQNNNNEDDDGTPAAFRHLPRSNNEQQQQQYPPAPANNNNNGTKPAGLTTISITDQAQWLVDDPMIQQSFLQSMQGGQPIPNTSFTSQQPLPPPAGADNSSSGDSTALSAPPKTNNKPASFAPLVPQFAANNVDTTWLQRLVPPNQLASVLAQVAAVPQGVCQPTGNNSAMGGLLQMLANANSAPPPPQAEAPMEAPPMTSTTTVPCRARGMSPEHVFKTAFFTIPADITHGADLVCSFPECRNGGVKFRFCAFCRIPVAKRNFRVRHGHADEMANSPTTRMSSLTPATAPASKGAARDLKRRATSRSPMPRKEAKKAADVAAAAAAKQDDDKPMRPRVVSNRSDQGGPPMEVDTAVAESGAKADSGGKSSSQIRIIESLDMVCMDDRNKGPQQHRGDKRKERKKSKSKKKHKKSKHHKSSKRYKSGSAAQAQKRKRPIIMLVHEDSRTATDDNNNISGSSDSQKRKEGNQFTQERMVRWARLLDARPPNSDDHNMSIWIEDVITVSNVHETLPPERDPPSTSDLSDSFESPKKKKRRKEKRRKEKRRRHSSERVKT